MKSSAYFFVMLCFCCPLLLYAQTGNLDPTFGEGDGVVTTSFVEDQRANGYGIAVQADGKIVVSGGTRTVGPIELPVLARYLPDGSPDESFHGTGKFIIPLEEASGYSQAVTLQPDGKIVMLATVYDGIENQSAVFRFNPDGSPDNGFDEDGVVLTTFNTKRLNVNALAIQPDGKILVGGYMGFDQDSVYYILVIRYLADGSPDHTFGMNGIDTLHVGQSYTSISALTLQPDGKILGAGYAVINNNEDMFVIRLHANGSPDLAFGVNGLAYTQFGVGEDRATGIGLQPDGKIVIGGYAHSLLTNYSAFAAARFHADGTLDESFAGDGMTTIVASGYADAARTAILQPDGKLLLGGYAHSNVTGGADMTMIRLDHNGLPDLSFDGDGIAIYEDGLLISSEIHELAIQPDGKIVGTGFNRVDGLNSIGVARIISGLTVSAADAAIPDVRLSIFPNPTQQEVNVIYSLDQSDIISIHLLDIQGRFIGRLMPPQDRSQGSHHETLMLRDDLAPGNYFINIVAERWNTVVRVAVGE
jgi:uncharacterized delta-60 repeat protein